MTFKDLRITAVRVEGPCSRTRLGATFYIRNACLEIPPGERVCMYALGSLLPVISGAMIRNEPEQGVLDLLQEWQCPDPEATVVFRIEEDKVDKT
ncbi:hypothetical protein AMJ74_05645 [candidate division WOR_3 bacterium SM1_77]|jgi:uncharacterized repeat protein (TIGR04076 family)|uniref:TIGR04076 family protein n=1 Tax=candidate division WOR_3 bacterium SM1_77 TaxID=1703778 RepID=A0A0S8JTQ1_UNCW3|nr:MAG: hypothetical protein AMJ74_05645 [candidate division WOR_3 bacterium SM1_77]